MNNYAYVTLYSNKEYIYCLLGLYSSWKRTNSAYPFYCACTPDIDDTEIEMLSKLGMNIIKMPKFEYNIQIQSKNIKEHMPLSFIRAFPKLQILSLPFDKIIYLDSDILLRDNIDILFNGSHMSAVTDLAFIQPDNPDFNHPGDRWFRYFNAGVLVLEPKPDLTDKIVSFMDNLPLDRTWNDQNILAAYYRNWPEQHGLHLPLYYNVLMNHIDSYMSYGWFNVDDIKVMHFVDRYKPIPRLWFGAKIKIPSEQPYLSGAVYLYFNSIDSFITENKKKGLIPEDFPLIAELQGVE